MPSPAYVTNEEEARFHADAHSQIAEPLRYRVQLRLLDRKISNRRTSVATQTMFSTVFISKPLGDHLISTFNAREDAPYLFT